MMTSAPDKPSWRQAVRSASKQDHAFAVCSDVPVLPAHSEPLRPLLILVHPGDAIELPHGWSSQQIADEVMARCKANLAGMTMELCARLQTHDLVVLHRQSSIDTFLASSFAAKHAPHTPIRAYGAACIDLSNKATVLYGDDLDGASQWMLDYLGAAQRPSTFLTGAYACAQYGCITAVGRALVAAGSSNVQLSPYAPTDQSNSSPRWDPSKRELGPMR